jgi:NAD+ kinase
MGSLQQILLVTKAGDEQAANLARQIREWLVAQGIQGEIRENTLAGSFLGHPEFLPDMAVVLGGDGTMLSVARKLHEQDIPLLGINVGHVGFLAESCAQGWESELACLVRGSWTVSMRDMLAFRVHRGGRVVAAASAVNDVVVGRGSLARLISLNVRYGNEFVAPLRADGLIVATATGSSGYAVSCGGPLVAPELSVFILAPICPFKGGFPPLVLGMDRPVHVLMEENLVGTCLTWDGQETFPLEAGDRVSVGRHAHPARFVRLQGSSYIARLREKGFVRCK